jgi:uncharacterized protein YjbI with pentapeptide repeats
MNTVRQQSYEEERLTGKNWQGYEFVDCDFVDCVIQQSNLSLAQFQGCTLINVTFKDCKVVSVNFGGIHEFITPSLSFEDCVLDKSSFDSVSFKKALIKNCSAKHAYFGRADLSEADCTGTDFQGAILSNANMREADFRGSINYYIDILQEHQNIKGAKFSNPEVLNLLKSLEIKLD